MPETLIIYRMGSLGDTIAALPCFHKIEEEFPGHRRVVLTNVPVSAKAAPVESILGAGGFIHGSIAYPYGTRSPRQLLSVMRQIRSQQATTLIYVGGGRGLRAVYRDLIFFRLAGIRKVIGAPLRSDLDRGRVERATGEMEPESTRLARCLADLGPIDLADPRSWDLRLTPAEIARADEVLGELAHRPFMVANTGGKLLVQDWGVPNWMALVSRLSTRLAVPLVFIGAPADSERAALLAPLWKQPVLDACGRLSPRETAALLRRATVFVGHDSGPLHLAAASGVPCVAMFGSNNPPGKWYPQGSQHRVHGDDTDVRRITPEAIEASVLELWSAIGPGFVA